MCACTINISALSMIAVHLALLGACNANTCNSVNAFWHVHSYLQEHGFSMPVFCDSSESFQSLIISFRVTHDPLTVSRSCSCHLISCKFRGFSRHVYFKFTKGKHNIFMCKVISNQVGFKEVTLLSLTRYIYHWRCYMYIHMAWHILVKRVKNNNHVLFWIELNSKRYLYNTFRICYNILWTKITAKYWMHFSWEVMLDMARNAFSKHGKERDVLHNNTSHHNCNINM